MLDTLEVSLNETVHWTKQEALFIYRNYWIDNIDIHGLIDICNYL